MANRRIGLLTLAAVSAAVLLGLGSQNATASTLTVRVAAISFVPTKFGLHGNADRLEDAFRQARRGGAQIAVAPEGALEGYVVNEIIAGEVPAEKMREVAIPQRSLQIRMPARPNGVSNARLVRPRRLYHQAES